MFIEKKSHDTISNLLCFPSYRTFVLISVKASFRTIIYWQAVLSEWYRIKRVKIKKTRISGLRKSKKRVNGFGTVDNYMGEMYYYLTTFSQQNYTVALLNISNLACLELLTMFIYKISYLGIGFYIVKIRSYYSKLPSNHCITFQFRSVRLMYDILIIL